MTHFFLVLVVVAISTTVSAFSVDQDDETSTLIGFDSIVQDLQKENGQTSRTSARKQKQSSQASDPFENIWIHAGAGFAQSTQNLNLPNGFGIHNAGRGVQAAIGIDILGPSFAAEGAVRSFGESDDSSSKVSLKEFDLKLFLKTRPQFNLALRAGGGLSARYMTVRTAAQVFDVTTPASVFSVGSDIYLSNAFSIGLDLSMRSALINETFDRSSYDGTLRLDTHF